MYWSCASAKIHVMWSGSQHLSGDFCGTTDSCKANETLLVFNIGFHSMVLIGAGKVLDLCFRNKLFVFFFFALNDDICLLIKVLQEILKMHRLLVAKSCVIKMHFNWHWLCFCRWSLLVQKASPVGHNVQNNGPLSHYHSLMYVSLHTVHRVMNKAVNHWYFCLHFVSQTRTVHHRIKCHDSEWPFASLQSVLKMSLSFKKYLVLF